MPVVPAADSPQQLCLPNVARSLHPRRRMLALLAFMESATRKARDSSCRHGRLHLTGPSGCLS
jgi:hypothetical protein